MRFTEANTAENYIIEQLTGVNLNAASSFNESKATYGSLKWNYIPPDELKREITEVFVELELKEALIRINSAIAVQPSRADEVIHKLRAILITVNQVGLVRANEDFAKWLKGEMTMPFGNNG